MSLRTDPELRDALAKAGVRTARDLMTLAHPSDAHNVGTRLDLTFAGVPRRFYLKAYRYPGWGKSKGLIGRGSLWGAAPCVREFDNLVWLRAHDMPAARPVAAASVIRAGRLAAHALLTAWIDDAPSLATRLAGVEGQLRTDPSALERVLHRLGSTVGLMHRMGFAHGDLFSRNILVQTTTGWYPRVWLLDCRRGQVTGLQRRLRADAEGLREDLRGKLVPARALEAFDFAYDAGRQGGPLVSGA